MGRSDYVSYSCKTMSQSRVEKKRYFVGNAISVKGKTHMCCVHVNVSIVTVFTLRV